MVSINITIPARNEEMILEKNLRELLDFCEKNIVADDWFVVLSESASTDKTEEIGQRLSATEPRLKYICNKQQGKGRAIRAGWESFPADYYVFMDADLSTDLEALPRLIQELKNGADLVIGSRYLPKSQTQRSLTRLIISKTYRLLARVLLGLPFSDLPCGFKGISDSAKQELLPLIKNEEWFFDTELLYRAWKTSGHCHSRESGNPVSINESRDWNPAFAGMTIKEIPVRWTETPNAGRKSRVGILRVSWNYIKELLRMKMSL